jgi:preprotein translocase subunit SecD
MAMMSTIVRSIFYLLILAVFCGGQNKNAAPAPSVEFRLVEACADAPGALYFPVSGDQGQRVAVNPELVISRADITAVKPRTEKFWVMFKRYERSAVQIKLTAAGTARLQTVIRNNLGRTLAIVIGGQVVCQVLLMNSMNGNTFVLDAGMNRNENAELARLLRHG